MQYWEILGPGLGHGIVCNNSSLMYANFNHLQMQLSQVLGDKVSRL